MPNLNNIILRASDFKLALTLPGPPANSIVLLTWENFSWNNDSETELIYAGGQDEPIGIKQSAYKYGGRLSLQSGEAFSILSLQGLPAMMKLGLLTLSVVELNGVFSQTYTGVMLKNDAGDVRRKEKETLVNMDWLAIGKK